MSVIFLQTGLEIQPETFLIPVLILKRLNAYIRVYILSALCMYLLDNNNSL